MSTIIWAASALLTDGWAEDVEIEVSPLGEITRVTSNQPFRQGERCGLLIPGIDNLHSHAHQRAMAGLGERASPGNDGVPDSFWTWRQVMYHYVERIQPEDLQAIAAQAYMEMLLNGYTSVAEFQYLHHQADGKAYDNPAEMSLSCQRAAEQVGIDLTMLPVLYRYGGFGGADPLPGQRRFLNSADSFIDIVARLQNACRENPNQSVGMAPHSLRAVSRDLLSEVMDQLVVENLAAIHIHIAEQTQEVDECLAWSGLRPVQWLLENFAVDARWCLIHATHMDAHETRCLAKSQAVAGLCPTTEANLGDGFFNALDYAAHGGCWGIGSDSQISVSPVEELRWLEYGQRLLERKRNLHVSADSPHTGRHLLEQAWQGGARACGRKTGRITPGYRANLLALDTEHARLVGRQRDTLLDSWIFATGDGAIRRVYVGGKKIIDDGRHPMQETIATAFSRTLEKLQ